MRCGDEACPACPEERPAAAALRRWVEEQARVNARLAELLASRQRRRAGYVPKRVEDDS